MSSVQLTNFTVISNHDVHYELQDKEGNVRIIDRSIPAYLSACCKKTQDYLSWYSSAENYYARTGVALFTEVSNPYIFPDKAYVKEEYPSDKARLNGLVQANKSVKKLLECSIHILKRAYGDSINGIEAAAKKYIDLQRHFTDLPPFEIVQKLTENYVTIASEKQIEALEEIFLLASLEEYPCQVTLDKIEALLLSISELQEKTLESSSEIGKRYKEIEAIHAQIILKLEDKGEKSNSTEIEKLLCVNSLFKELLEHKEAIDYCYRKVIEINAEPIRTGFYLDVTQYLAKIKRDFATETNVSHAVIHEVLSKMYNVLSTMYSEDVNMRAEFYGLFEYYCARCYIIHGSHFKANDDLSNIHNKLSEIYRYISTECKSVCDQTASQLLLESKPLWEAFYTAVSDHPQLCVEFEPYINMFGSLLMLYNMNALEDQHLNEIRQQHTEVMRMIPFAKRIIAHEKKIIEALPANLDVIVLEQERLFCTRLELANDINLITELEVLQLLENASKTYPQHYQLFLEHYLLLQNEAQALFENKSDLAVNREKRKKLLDDYQLIQGFQTSIDCEYNALMSFNTPSDDLNNEVYRVHALAKGMAQILEIQDIIETIWSERETNYQSNYQYANQSHHEFFFKFLNLDLNIDRYRHREGVQALILDTLVKLFNKQFKWYSQNKKDILSMLTYISDYYQEAALLNELYDLDEKIKGHENFIASLPEPTTVGEISGFLMTKIGKREEIIQKVFKQYALLQPKKNLPSIAALTSLQAIIDEKISQVVVSRKEDVQKLVLLNKQLCELSILQESFFNELIQFINAPRSLTPLVKKRQCIISYLSTFSDKKSVQDKIIDLLFELDKQLQVSYPSSFDSSETVAHFKFDSSDPVKSFSNEKYALIKNTQLLDLNLKILPYFFKYHNLPIVQFSEVASYAAKSGAPYSQSDPFKFVNTPLQVSFFYPYVQNIAHAQATLWNAIQSIQDFENAPSSAQINQVHQALDHLKHVVDKAKREIPLQLEFSNCLKILSFWYDCLNRETTAVNTDNPYTFFTAIYNAYLLRNEALENIFSSYIKAFEVKKKLGTLKSPIFNLAFLKAASADGIELNRQARHLVEELNRRDLAPTIQDLVQTIPDYRNVFEANLKLLPLLETTLLDDSNDVNWVTIREIRVDYRLKYTDLLNRLNSPRASNFVPAEYSFSLSGMAKDAAGKIPHTVNLALDFIQQHFVEHAFVPLSINDKCSIGISTSSSLFNPTETQLLVRNHKELFVVDAGKAAFQHVNNARTIVSQNGKHHLVFSFANGNHAVNLLVGNQGSSIQIANRFTTAHYATGQQPLALSVTTQPVEVKQEPVSKMPWKDLPFRMAFDSNTKNFVLTSSYSSEKTSVHAVANTGAINEAAALVTHELENGSVSALINPLQPLNSLFSATYKINELNTDVSIVASQGNLSQAALVATTSIGEATKAIAAMHPANPALSTFVIQQRLLNKKMQIALVAAPANVKEASLNVAYDTQKFDLEGNPVKESSYMLGVNVPVMNPSHISVIAGAKIYHSDAPDCKDATTPFASLNLKDPKDSFLGVVSTFENTTVGIGITPNNLKNPAILAQHKLNVPRVGNLTVGGQLNLKKPMASTVSVQVPIPVYGVPVSIGVSTQLRRLDEARVTVGVYNVPIISVKIKNIVKPVVQAHINAVNAVMHDIPKGIKQLGHHPLKGAATLAVVPIHASAKALSPVVNAAIRPISRAAGKDLHKAARKAKRAAKQAHKGLKRAGKKLKKAFKI